MCMFSQDWFLVVIVFTFRESFMRWAGWEPTRGVWMFPRESAEPLR